MNPQHQPILDSIESQQNSLAQKLQSWANINSYSFHLPGLAKMADVLAAEMNHFGPVQRISFPPTQSINAQAQPEDHPLGQALRVTHNPTAPLRILLNIHYDTVYPPDSPFQSATLNDANTLRGPGVLDAKGGILVLLTAARAIIQSPFANKIGLEIILTPDEEIGSPGSGPLLVEAAKRNHLALLFEPALPDGSLVGARKGSGNFTFIIRGKAAHAGRDFHAGRSAILAAAKLIQRFDEPFTNFPDITINCGKIEGGGPLNVVPDLAIARFNARVNTPEEQSAVEQRAQHLVTELSAMDGISVTKEGGFHAPPKLLDKNSSTLLNTALTCAKELGFPLQVKPSGGASDGNRIAPHTPVIDSLGPVGAHLHSHQEYIHLPSLIQRAKLTTLLILTLAQP
jgi:glutamate carboxypeptidase